MILLILFFLLLHIKKIHNQRQNQQSTMAEKNKKLNLKRFNLRYHLNYYLSAMFKKNKIQYNNTTLNNPKNNSYQDSSTNHYHNKTFQNNHSNKSYSQLESQASNKKGKYKERQFIQRSVAEELSKKPTHYHSLSEKDSLYRQNRFLLKSREFQHIVRRTTRQLSILLELTEKEFFNQLEQNQSLRICLQSCLTVFPRRVYNRLQRYDQRVKDVSFQDQSYLIYSLLMKVVLVVYLRISRAKDQLFKDIIYNQWLIDIPKLLDVAAIFGQSNPYIVSQIIQNTYKINENYDGDVMTFFNLVQNGKLDELERSHMDDIDFSAESLDIQNFGNRQEFMVSETMKYLFVIKDILFNLSNFLKYFPKKYTYQFVTDYKIQEKLINGFSFFMNQVNNSWKLQGYRQKLFKLHLEDLRQSMILYFINEFQMLKKIIRQKQPGMKDVEEAAHNTYETYCLLFQAQNKRKYHHEYKKLINNLIQQTEDDIFFLDGQLVMNSNEKTRKVIDQCQEYQKKYRRQHKLGGIVSKIDEIYTKNKLNLQKFRSIYMKNESEQVKKFKQKKQKQSKESLPFNQQFYSYVNRLKYGKISQGLGKQYDDQPQEQQFKIVQLQNQLRKIQNSQKTMDLSFAVQKNGAKKKYVQKDSVNKKPISQKKRPVNKADYSSLSFSYDSKVQQVSSLSFFMDDQGKKDDLKLDDLNLDIDLNHNNNIQKINLSRLSFEHDKSNAFRAKQSQSFIMQQRQLEYSKILQQINDLSQENQQQQMQLSLDMGKQSLISKNEQPFELPQDYEISNRNQPQVNDNQGFSFYWNHDNGSDGFLQENIFEEDQKESISLLSNINNNQEKDQYDLSFT